MLERGGTITKELRMTPEFIASVLKKSKQMSVIERYKCQTLRMKQILGTENQSVLWEQIRFEIM